MNDRRAFNPIGKTVVVAGATTAPSGVQVLSLGAPAAEQYRIYNSGAVLAHVAFGVDASTAQTNAVIPTGSGSNSKSSFPIPAGAIEVVSALPNCYWSAITPSSTADVFVTPGSGL